MQELRSSLEGHPFLRVHSEVDAGSENGSLPLLEPALSRETMARRLEALLGGGLEVQKTGVLSLRPGRRALLYYDISDRHGSRRVLGKLYSEPVRALRCREILTALSRESSSRNLGFRVPFPLGCLSDLNLVLFAPVEGRRLGELISSVRPASFRRTGSCLAQLHGCSPPLDRHFDVYHEVANLRLWSREVVEGHPSEGGGAPELAELVGHRAPGLEFRADVPIHKDFHAHHVIVAPALGIIDVDEMRWGDPSADVAHFCAYLRLSGMRAAIPRPTVEALQSAFLDGYAADDGSSWRERIAFFGICACLKIARQLRSMTGVPPIPEGGERDRQLAAIIDYGHELAGRRS